MNSPEETTLALASRVRDRRLALDLTQQGLAQRAGVALPTLRKFERTGKISLVSFVRLSIALKDEAALDGLLAPAAFETLDDVLETTKRPKRGRIT